MNYEQKYKEALERAKKALVTEAGLVRVGQCVLEDIFPELGESEDERIRRVLIDHFNLVDGKERYLDPNCEVRVKDILVWLEKQKPVECHDLYDEIADYINKHFHIRYDETLEIGNDPLTTSDFEEIAEHFYQLGAKKQKPIEWSEEDDKRLNEAAGLAYEVGDRTLYNWLDSLKGRITG